MEDSSQSSSKLVDFCATNGATDYDIARIVAVYPEIRNKHRYNDNGWESFDEERKEWRTDTRGMLFGGTVTLLVSTACNERALYWQNKVMAGESSDPQFDELRVMALIELALKFRDKAFLRGVVNECKAFFE